MALENIVYYMHIITVTFKDHIIKLIFCDKEKTGVLVNHKEFK